MTTHKFTDNCDEVKTLNVDAYNKWLQENPSVEKEIINLKGGIRLRLAKEIPDFCFDDPQPEHIPGATKKVAWFDRPNRRNDEEAFRGLQAHEIKSLFDAYQAQKAEVAKIKEGYELQLNRVMGLQGEVFYLRSKQSSSKDEGWIRVKTNQETGEEFPDGEWRKDPYVTSGRIAKRLNLPECFEYGVIFTKRNKSEPMPYIWIGDELELNGLGRIEVVWCLNIKSMSDGFIYIQEGEQRYCNRSYAYSQRIKHYRNGKLIWSKTDDEK